MNVLRKIGPWIVSAALCLLAVEVVGAARYYWVTGNVVYFNKSKAAAVTAAAAASLLGLHRTVLLEGEPTHQQSGIRRPPGTRSSV